jgi:hypothetical protein
MREQASPKTFRPFIMGSGNEAVHFPFPSLVQESEPFFPHFNFPGLLLVIIGFRKMPQKASKSHDSLFALSIEQMRDSERSCKLVERLLEDSDDQYLLFA